MKGLNKLLKKLTKDYTEIPLLWVMFDYQKYQQSVEGSCMLHIHPDLGEDEKLKQMLNDVVDYIRDNYDMERFTKI